MKKTVHTSFVCLLLITLSGCATYGGSLQTALLQVENQQYEVAENTLRDVLPEQGKDELLHYLELGMVKHLDGQYQESNRLLEQAHDLADYLNSASATENIAVAMSNPRQGVYRGTDYERTLINLVKAMNSLLLAQEDPEGSVQHLDNARVEIRRLEIQLQRLEAEFGDYGELQQERERNFFRLTELFSSLANPVSNPDELIYRTDPWAYYLAGFAYEKQGEYEAARIAYQNSLAAYRDGAIFQYQLDADMELEARLAYLRNASRSGFDAGELEPERSRLPDDLSGFVTSTASDGEGEILLIQNVGMIPPRGELNLVAYVQDWGRMLVLEPVLTGDFYQRNDQLSWFITQYGDLSIGNMLVRYANGGVWQMLDGAVTEKKVPLGPSWGFIHDIGLYDVLKSGLRVTVPYYPSLHWSQPGKSHIRIEQQGQLIDEQPLLIASSPASIALQELMRTANRELRLATAREAVKAMASRELSQQFRKTDSALGQLFAAATQVAAITSSAAETRGWLTLPREIRMRRMKLPAGDYQVQIETNGRTVINPEQWLTVTVNPGELTLVNLVTPLRRDLREILY